MKTINISNYKKSDVLRVLYNNSKPLGLGMLQFTAEDMSKQEAEQFMKKQTYFDYLKGRVMKVDLSGDELNPWLYDRDNGEGAALNAIKNNI